MLTREHALRRLADLEREIGQLRRAIGEAWVEPNAPDETEAFLATCEGWEDPRPTEEIIAEIYSTRTSTDRCADLFDEDRG